MSRPLVLAAHGTASAEGQATVEAVAAAAAAALGVPSAVGYVDVCGPTLEEVLVGRSDLAEPPVIVPFFLASGYHVRHDVPAAVALAPGSVVTPALGVEEEVVAALAELVHDVDPDADAVVLTAAGTSVESARQEVVRLAALLGERLRAAAGVAFLTGEGPRPQEEVARLRAAGSTSVVIAAHLLAPGFFLERARQAGVETGAPVTGPLGVHPLLTDLVVRRYREAGATAGG